MITKADLQEAIAECLGQKNPNASTCVKLAAYYTIMSNLYPDEEKGSAYSFAAPPLPDEITFESDTEFGRAINGKDPFDIWQIMDELMATISVLNPRLYASVMRRIEEK